jgi:hypothetical protein
MKLNCPSYSHSKPHRSPRIKNWQSFLYQAVRSQGFVILKLEAAIWTQNNCLWILQPLHPERLNEINKQLFLSYLTLFINSSHHMTVSHECADLELPGFTLSSLSHPEIFASQINWAICIVYLVLLSSLWVFFVYWQIKKNLSYKIKQSILVARRKNISPENLKLKGQNLLMSFQAQSS